MTAGSWTQKDSAPCLCIPKLARENTTFGNCQHRTSPKLWQSQIPTQTSPLPAWCCFCFLSAACKCVLLRFVIHMHPHGWRTLLRSVCESVCMIARQQLHGNIITHNQTNPWHLHESSMPYAISIGVSFARFSTKQTSTLQKITSNFAKNISSDIPRILSVWSSKPVGGLPSHALGHYFNPFRSDNPLPIHGGIEQMEANHINKLIYNTYNYQSICAIYIYTYTYIHTCIHTYVRTYVRTYIPFHSIPFHHITLHYITLHYITLH